MSGKSDISIKRVLAILRERKRDNPYPADLFPWARVIDKNFHYRRDAMFGTFGRKVYNNCIKDIERAIKEEYER